MDETKQLPEGWRTWNSPNGVSHAVPPTGPCATCGQAHPVAEFTWKIVFCGRLYETVGVAGGEWHLMPGAGFTYTLCPVDSCRGVEISGQHGLYYAIDIATAFIKERS